MKNQRHTQHKSLKKINKDNLYKLAYKTILELETPYGINASGKSDRFATFFGRDSMITGLKLLKVYKKRRDEIYLRIIRNTLKTAQKLQGKTVNPLSGEEPGKIVHEFRKKGYHHLINKPKPWYLYPDKTIRNYDSVDSTLLYIILAGEFYKFIKDDKFLKEILPSIELAFRWAKNSGHKKYQSEFIQYFLQRPDPYGGLVNQGWMDSPDSLLITGQPPKEPVALVEVQAYYFKALKLWSKIVEQIDQTKAQVLNKKAGDLKEHFNELFLIKTENLFYYAQAIFGNKAHILERRSNPGHCLWASIESKGKHESIIDDKYIPDVVERLMKPDLFVKRAGIRTLTTKSKFFNFCSYHNGSIWPFDNGLVAEGFENFGYKSEATKIKDAVLRSISHFNTPIELYCVDKENTIEEYREKEGFYGSHKQAWTAATILDFVTDNAL